MCSDTLCSSPRRYGSVTALALISSILPLVLCRHWLNKILIKILLMKQFNVEDKKLLENKILSHFSGRNIFHFFFSFLRGRRTGRNNFPELFRALSRQNCRKEDLPIVSVNCNALILRNKFRSQRCVSFLNLAYRYV